MDNTDKYDVVAFGSHPDDVEWGMGGTLLKLARDGARVLIVHATRGEGGTHGDVALREREARAAADLAGADVAFLDFKDTALHDTPEARRTVVALLREARPHTVFAPYYDYPHMHPDHEELGLIVRGVSRPIRIRSYAPDAEPHRVRHFFYYILPPTLAPTFVVDVTDRMDEWERLAGCYASQMGGVVGIRERLLTFRRHYGAMIDRPYAEAFYSDLPIDLTPIDFNDLNDPREFRGMTEEEAARSGRRPPGA